MGPTETIQSWQQDYDRVHTNDNRSEEQGGAKVNSL